MNFTALLAALIKAILAQGLRGLRALPAILWLRTAMRDLDRLIAEIKAGTRSEPQPELREHTGKARNPPHQQRRAQQRQNSPGPRPPKAPSPEIREKPPLRPAPAGSGGALASVALPAGFPREREDFWSYHETTWERPMRSHGHFVTIS